MSEKKSVPDMLIEQLLLQELPAEQQNEILRRLEEEEGGMERLPKLHLSNGEILADYPPHEMSAKITRRINSAKAKRRVKTRILWVAPLLPAAAACAILLWLAIPFGYEGYTTGRPQEATQSKVEVTRTKGEPRLLIYRKRGRSVEELRHLAEVKPKDVLQLRYLSAGARHGMIFSIDGRGSVTLHFPETVGHSTALSDGAVHTLPYAYELDDAPGFERFFFVTSLSPIDIKAVLELGHGLGSDVSRPLLLGAGLEQTSLNLRKTPAGQKVEL